jgi:hypothetical protein
MNPASSFHDQLEDDLHQAREHASGEGLERRYEAEQEDREFVRAALQGAVPEEEIERKLLLRSEFVRLNPDRDPHTYARGLIDEEKSSFHALSAPVPPSLEDTVPKRSQQPNPTSLAATNGEAGPTPLSKRHATDRAETTQAAPHRSGLQSTGHPNQRAEASEAAVRQYLNENFEPSDKLAVVVRNRESGETIQRMSTAQRIASPEFQAWLRYKNAHGSDIYVSLNTFQDQARGRTKADLKEIRHLYLDLDEDGARKLDAIHHDSVVPTPNYVLNTSPEKYQVIWRVEGIGQDEAEALLRGLAQRFGGDPAATDSTRVFRVPGFANKKYEHDFEVTLTPENPAGRVYHASDFKADGRVQEPEHPASASSGPTPRNVSQRDGNSQSEKDWNYAIRKLKAGEDPDKIIRDMAQYRSVDRYDKKDPSKVVAPSKPNPRYYAEHTVVRAMAHLGMTRQPARLSTQPGGSSANAEIEPSR